MRPRKNFRKPRRSLPATRARWPVFGRRLTALTVASIVTAALSLTGCASSRKSVTAKEAARTEASDSTVTETRRVTALPVPKSEVSLTLNADSLLDLPAGASYHARSGRANLDVKRGTEPGTIVVYASCDSLQRLVEYYERLACKYKETLDRQSEEVKEEKKPPGVWWKVLAALTTGFFTGIVITLKTKRQNGKE
ncbi:hypothetical protein BFAG_03302 [Bacteroides fragilis 3_1_12]|uniref:Lipoprotein n=1 Tax=Bacteroides fragilis 3_1_12 TaxID=457424 RepID=A0ABN0BP04_BACFG|nr:hypothetical protein BFAG_03302 [Bacteroides fragilis 3_1_12]